MRDAVGIMLGEEKAKRGDAVEIMLGSQSTKQPPEQPKIDDSSIIDKVVDFAKSAYNEITESQWKAAQARIKALPKNTQDLNQVKSEEVKIPPELRGYFESYMGLPRGREREGADIASSKIPPSMSAISPKQAQQELAKPLPMPKYTGSTGEQLLSTFAGNIAEGFAKSISLGIVGGVGVTPQGVTGELPLGILGQVIGNLPMLSMMGKGFHVATQAIVKGLPEGMKAITEAAIKLGFTTDMMTNALHSSVDFIESAKSGNTQGMIDFGSSVLIDSLFSFLIAKGLPNDARKLADFKVAMNAAEQSGIPKDVFMQSYGMATGPFKGLESSTAALGPSEELKATADKTAYEPEIKEEIKTVNETIVPPKNVRTRKYKPLEESEFDKLLGPAKGDLEKLKDWSDYPPDKEVARVKGKKEEELVVEDYEEVKADEEAKLDEVDFEIGEKAPETLTTEVSPFRTEKDVTLAQANNYAKSLLIAKDWAELTEPESIKSPLVTVSKLINDFNQHLDGSFKGNIEQSKDFISKIAANVNDFEVLFEGDKAEFKEFSDYVSNAAKWMRDTSKKGTGTSLYFGLPIDEAYGIMKPWFSALKRFAEEKLPRIASAEQILATLRKGSTKDEWEAVGLSSVLEPGKKYTKEEILKIVDEGMVEFKDVILDSNINPISPVGAEEAYTRRTGIHPYTFRSEGLGVRTVTGYTEDYLNSNEYKSTLGEVVKFPSYVEPGGTNYKELFVTAPVNIEKYVSSVEAGKELRTWQDGHSNYSDIENPVTRLRFNDRVDAQGNKVLFIEELQGPAGDDIYKVSNGRSFNHRKIAEWYAKKNGLSTEITKIPSGEQAKMPEALRKRIREIGMKRALKYAIDGGYDRLAWTTGEMQANRYSLSKYADSIEYEKSGHYDNLNVIIRGKSGDIIHEASNMEPDQVASYVGEGLAIKMSDSSSDKIKVIKGLDLNTGGEGLRKLYDQDLPNVAKKLGGVIEEVDLSLRPKLDYRVEKAVDGKYAVYEMLDEGYTIIGDKKFNAFAEAQEYFNQLQNDVPSQIVLSTPLSSFREKAKGGFSLYSGIPVEEIVKRLKKIHPATYPKSIQSELANIVNELGVTDILDIFGGVGKIGKLKDYGYKGTVRSNEIEPQWGGKDTISENKKNGVDYVTIGDSKKLPYKSNSRQAIVTSPTYGNLMALKSPSKIDSYQALAGGSLQEGNTGGEVWGPIYEQLHKDIYKESYRVIKPGGFFILNMKDKPVSATDQKNNWIPKRGSTVEVRDNVMRATDWHIRALQEAGFEFITSTPVKEAEIANKAGSHKFGRQYTTGEENIVVMGKPDKMNVRPFTFYSGIPTDKLDAAGKKILDYEKKLAGASRKAFKDSLKGTKEVFTSAWLNQSGNARRAMESQGDKAYEVLQATAFTRGAHPRTVNEFKQASKEVFSGLSKNEAKDIDRLILANTVIDISKGPKGDKVTYPEGYSPEESQFLIDNIGSGKVNMHGDYNPQQEMLIKKSAQAYFDAIKRTVDDAFESGLIGLQEAEALKSRNYSRMTPAKIPTIAELADKKHKVPGTTGQYVWDSGTEQMKVGGDNNLFVMNSRLKMLEFMDRFYNRIMTNDAKKSMVSFAKSSPKNSFAYVDNPEIVKLEKQPDTITELRRSVTIKRYENKISDYEFNSMVKKQFGESFKNLVPSQLKELDLQLGPESKGYKRLPKHPKGWVSDTYYENGAEKTFWLEPKFASEWMKDTKELSGNFGKFVRIFSGSSLVKMFATGINPAFAIANLPRDVMHAWFASRVMEDGKWKSLYSTWVPKAAGQFIGDFKDIAVDTIFRRGWVNDYISDGGGTSFLYKQGMIGGGRQKVRLDTPFDALYDGMSYINETSELLTRGMIRNRVIKRRAKELGISYNQASKDPKIRKEATFAALDQMNFGEGGSYAKALDNAIPYLNARIVGTRSLWRVFDPRSGTAEQSALKLGQFAALVVGAYLLNKKRNPQGMEDLKSDPRSINSLVIPFSKEAGIEVEGQIRYPFWRMPIDNSQAFFKTLFEGIAEKMTGGEVNPIRIVKALKSALPADISNLSPTLQAIIGYYTNTNIWSGEKIWESQEGTIPYRGPQWLTKNPVKGSELEQRAGTPEIYKDLGTATGMSPERLKYSIESLLTSDNIYSQITFSMYDKIFGGLDNAQKKMMFEEVISRKPVIKRFYGLTNPAAQDIKEAKEINQDRINIRQEHNISFDNKVNDYFTGNGSLAELREYVNSLKDSAERDRLGEKFKFVRDTKNLPSKQWWFTLKNMDSQGRAEAFVAKLKKIEAIDRANGNTKMMDSFRKEVSRFGDPKDGKIGGVITEDFNARVNALK